MLTSKQLKLMEKLGAQQREVVTELNALVKDIERCEKTITDLKNELEAVNLNIRVKQRRGKISITSRTCSIARRKNSLGNATWPACKNERRC
jgi:hypothetical protein